jgi:transcriptional regulator with XRE-family HTH domain
MATLKSTRDVIASSICVRIGSRIRELRDAKGWSQRMLADHAGIEQAHLARLENGLVEPGVLILEKIAQALGVQVRELL